LYQAQGALPSPIPWLLFVHFFVHRPYFFGVLENTWDLAHSINLPMKKQVRARERKWGYFSAALLGQSCLRNRHQHCRWTGDFDHYNRLSEADESQKGRRRFRYNQGDRSVSRGPMMIAVIRVYDESGNVIQTHEYAGDFKES
jgi:hypothetical protein